MATEQLALVIVAGIWAALNTLVSAYRVVNEKRDVIVTGVSDGQKLSLEHRRLMFKNDWIPLKFGIALVSLVFGLVLAAIPMLSQTPNVWIVRISYAAAIAPFVSFFGFGVLGFSDYRFIQRMLDKAAESSISEPASSAQT